MEELQIETLQEILKNGGNVIKTRDEVLNNEDTNERYQLLKLKVKLNLID